MIVLTAAYLLGSLPFSFVVARLLGVEDVRKVGSGNVGATNVMTRAKPTTTAMGPVQAPVDRWLLRIRAPVSWLRDVSRDLETEALWLVMQKQTDAFRFSAGSRVSLSVG